MLPTLLERLRSRWARPPARVGYWILLGNCLVALVLCLATALNLSAARRADLARAGDASQNLAHRLGVEMAAELHLVEHALITVARRLQVEPLRSIETVPPALQQLVREQQQMIPFVATLRYANLDGHVARDGTVEPGAYVGDRDYFRRALATDAVVLSEPLTARCLGDESLVLARRVTDGRGRPQGVVFAVLSVRHFQELFAQLELGAGGAISLHSESGRVVARHVAPEVDARAGLVPDDVRRVNAFQRLPGYPLVLIVGLGTEPYRARWYEESLRHWGFTVAVMLLVAGGSVYVQLQQRRLRAVLNRASTLADQQEKMLNNDLVGMLKLRERRIVWSNRASESLFGYSHREMEGLPARELYCHESDYEAVGVQALAAFQRGEQYRCQVQMKRHDGEPIWVDIGGVRLASEDGEDLWMLLDISAMKRQHERIEHVAFHDGLTGLPNRLLLIDRLHQAVQRCLRTQELLAVCFVDLDGFKLVNDSHGHAAGDALLRETAHRLLAELRAHDTVARVGGDEFVLLLPNLHGRSEAEEVVERLAATVARPVTLPDGSAVRVGASIGLACWPTDGQTEDDLLAAADRAMYADKARRRLRVV